MGQDCGLSYLTYGEQLYTKIWFQTRENQDDNQWPRFLIMEAADQKVPLNLNAFVLKKAIDGMANAELDNVKPMKSGSVFIEVETKQQCKNLLKTTKLLGYLPVKVSPHRTLNSSKFVIKCEELDIMDEEEIKKNFNHKESLLSKGYPYDTVCTF